MGDGLDQDCLLKLLEIIFFSGQRLGKGSVKLHYHNCKIARMSLRV